MAIGVQVWERATELDCDRPRWVMFLVGLVLAGCSSGSPPPQICTLIGCESGLEIVLEARPAGAFRVEASAPGQPARVIDCPTAASCERIFFDDFTPDSVTVRVTAAAGAMSWNGRPSYRTLQPNGPACPPTCRQATVRVGSR
jgi:hypothetical protein